MTKYPFVGFCDAIYYGGQSESDSDKERERNGFKRDREYEIRERCAACHREEFANVSEMYLAGGGYDSNGVSGSQHGHTHAFVPSPIGKFGCSSVRRFFASINPSMHASIYPSIDPSISPFIY